MKKYVCQQLGDSVLFKTLNICLSAKTAGVGLAINARTNREVKGTNKRNQVDSFKAIFKEAEKQAETASRITLQNENEIIAAAETIALLTSEVARLQRTVSSQSFKCDNLAKRLASTSEKGDVSRNSMIMKKLQVERGTASRNLDKLKSENDSMNEKNERC